MHPRAIVPALLLTFAPALAQPQWNISRTHLPVGAGYSIAYGNGRFVATLIPAPLVPAAAWSEDGIHWESAAPLIPFPSQSLSIQDAGKIVFVDGAFYVVGSRGIARSTDGYTWTKVHEVSETRGYSDIASNGRGLFYAQSSMSANAQFITADRANWQAAAPLPYIGAPDSWAPILGLVFGAGRYFAYYHVYAGSKYASHAAATTDGHVWVSTPELAGPLAAGNGRVVAINGDQTPDQTLTLTEDGRTFSRVPLGYEITRAGRILFVGGRFFMTRTSYASVDGRTWTRLPVGPLPVGLEVESMAYGRGRYVAVGRDSRDIDVADPAKRETVDFVAWFDLPAPPMIRQQPDSQTVVEGTGATFSITLENPSPFTTFQWRRDSRLIPGATRAIHSVEAAALGDSGRYVCEVRNPEGTVTSEAATLLVVPMAQAGRISNFSVLTRTAPPDDSLVVGFVLGGVGTSGEKPVLIRAVGPSLAPFGLGGLNLDPSLELESGGLVIARNDDWGGSPVIASTTARLGAFSFASEASKDAAIFAQLSGVDYTLRVSGASGVTMAEIYDATTADQITPTSPRLVNVSTRQRLASGGTLEAGFVITGATPRKVLIRAVGPALTAFGISDALANPQIELWRAGADLPLTSNDDWVGTGETAAAFARTGAFALPAHSKDSALVATVPPGNYVARASGEAGSSGVVLIEVYDVP